MNSGATAERVYDRLKAQILRGAFRPGDRLDPSVLAEPLAASVTPVRDALHRLTGELLVESWSGGGFHMPPLDEPTLRDRYAWSSTLLLLALRDRPARAPYQPEDKDTEDAIDRTTMVFGSVVHRSGNSEQIVAMRVLNDRLHAPRCAEARIFPDIVQEIDLIADAVKQDITASLRRLIRLYHVRRQRHSAEIVRFLYRGL